MNLFLILLAKDLRRIVRNPIPLLIMLAIPMAISSVIGFAFGGMGGGDDAQVAPIRLGMLDEDHSLFSRFLRGATGQEDFSKRIQLTMLEDEAQGIDMIQEGKLSAVLVIPEGFTEAFVNGENGIKLRLIKNPSEYIYPTLAQQGAEVIVTSLNALVRNFQKDLQELHGLLEKDRDFDLFRDVLAVSTLVERAQNRIDAAQVYLNPPLVSFKESSEQETEPEDADVVEQEKPESSFNLFAYLLIGMVAMFMLMIGDNCMRDLYKESRFRTLERYRTVQEGLWVFVAVKVAYTVIVLIMAAGLLLGVGSMLFGYGWQHFGPSLALILSYALFGAGFMGLVGALAGKERRADMLNTMIVIFMAASGGAMWPVESLPPFIRTFITPYSPANWFSESLRALQMDAGEYNWMRATGLLLVLGLVCISGAAYVFRVRLERGIKE